MAEKQASGGDKSQEGKEPEITIIEEGQEGYDAEQAAGKRGTEARGGDGKGEGGDAGGDQRLGHEPGADGGDTDGTSDGKGGESEAELSARQRRRRREAAARAAERAEIERLRTENRQLNDRLTKQDSRIANVETTSIDGQIEALQLELRRANAVMARAMQSQNGDDFVAAQDIRDTLRDRLSELQRAKTATKDNADRGRQDGTADERRGVTDRQATGAPNMTPSQLHNARIFIGKHPWYNPASGDGDSVTVTAIDNAMMAEGLNPSQADYWQELEQRVYEELPHRKPRAAVAGDQDGGGKNGGDTGGRRNGKAGGPKLPGSGGSGGGAGGGGTQTFHLSRERKQALIDLGVWDNPEERNKHIRNFVRWDKEHANT